MSKGFDRRSTIQRFGVFGCVVVIPTLLSMFYYFVIAAPQYVSVAEFVVRGAGHSSSGMLGSLLMGEAGSAADQDAYVVQDYLISRDAARKMIKTENLAEVFDRPEGDKIARFPNFYSGSTFEYFYKFYKKHVTVELDTETSISTLKVVTFRPTDSQRIATALLSAGEELVNDMNRRQRANTVGSAQRELEDAQKQLTEVAKQTAFYRNQMALLDPTKQSLPLLADINQLQVMLVTLKMQLSQIQQASPSSPSIAVYRQRIAILENQIKEQQSHITGPNTSLVPKITVFDALEVQKKLVEKELEAAATALVTAKAQADRQQVYLEAVSRPDLPDYAEYPHRIIDVLIVFSSFLMLYWMGKLIVNGAKEHQTV
ncbi:capsule polysaccharide transporter [Gluconobacter morbifer]|uniref:Putative capsule polysaccharide export inner-membrane protein ctrB n=1 Tax=Gluconobacter morbifer G707 TaxID=1088869 RepID=G6XLU4_9PROT|nr:capsule polysaccharide transporter [Gluconobacter morbifer]EHH67349.1 putative capsule polysaccharide export inner-membrane protein ctrB [Gluconobacter morbifer G707]